MEESAQQAKKQRRAFLIGSVAATAALVPISARAATQRIPFDRAAYDRYVQLMNAGNPLFVDYYDDDIKFVMNIRGKADVLKFYARQRPYIKEVLSVLFFCSDMKGAAAQVHSQVRCIKDCNDETIFGRTLKVGEVQDIRGCLLYSLNDRGKIVEINGPPPEILVPWHQAS